jgi:endonuclease/exonuclease/phosphatase family metal-dependent hydrolase
MRVKFICLNLELGGKMIDRIVEFFQKEDPDILALQEVYNGQALKLEKRLRSFEFLKQKLGFDHALFSPAVIDVYREGKLEQGNAILSKFPILDTKTVFYDVPIQERTHIEGPGDYTLTPRNLQRAAVDIAKIKINIFNTQGIWNFDGNDNERRIKMSEVIVREIKGRENVILAGDFNTWPETETMKMIGNNLTNVFQNKIPTTFNMKRKNPEFIPMIVDYMFVSPNLKIIDHYCPSVDISDHLPLVCVFEI